MTVQSSSRPCVILQVVVCITVLVLYLVVELSGHLLGCLCSNRRAAAGTSYPRSRVPEGTRPLRAPRSTNRLANLQNTFTTFTVYNACHCYKIICSIHLNRETMEHRFDIWRSPTFIFSSSYATTTNRPVPCHLVSKPPTLTPLFSLTLSLIACQGPKA